MVDDTEFLDEETLLAKHRREKKELQSNYSTTQPYIGLRSISILATLYCAVDYALGLVKGEEIGYQNLRNLTSQYLRKNCSDFLPFTSDPMTGDTLSQEQYEAYCDQIANTSSWGGQMELRALSHILKCPIEVIQAIGPPIVIGEEYTDQKSLILTYHRHMYRLGEHYNAVKPRKDENQDDM